MNLPVHHLIAVFQRLGQLLWRLLLLLILLIFVLVQTGSRSPQTAAHADAQNGAAARECG